MDLTAAALRLALGRRMPRFDGTLHVAGLQAPLTIRRDRHAVPIIKAQTDADAWYGLGFCQAQDRAFQLELRLRTARGTLSALAGEPTLPIDRLARRIGFLHSAEAQLGVLDADMRAQVEAFVRGLNAGLDTSPTPPELVLLRTKPSRWTPADVLAVGKLVSFLLIGNWDVELSRLKILTADGPDALRDLDPAYAETHPVSMPPGAAAGPALDRLSDDLAAFVAFAGQGGGSNNWVLSGARTASGRPILANDPHLDPSLPPHWYLAHLKAPGWAVAGAALVGLPAIGVGHNGHAAWGLTAALSDTVDLFIEEPSPDGRSVRRGDGFEPCERRRELIDVRGRTAVVEDVIVTPRGPIISPALDPGFGAISLRAMWLDPLPVRGFLRAHRSRDFETFRRHFEAWPVLGQNVVYADATGTIGWQLTGQTPRRRKGWGTLPLPAADPETGWHDGPVPFDEMPYAIDPAAGFLATANNKPQADGTGPYLGVDWLDGYRAGRIAEALSTREDWTLAATMRLQMDETSLAWREVRHDVLAVPASSDDTRLALALLRDWDGDLAAASAAASVFELFVAEMWRRLAKARAPRSSEWALGRGFTPLLSLTTFAAGRSSTILRRLRQQPPGWLPRPWPEEMADALAEAVGELRRHFGPEPSAWGWGRIRPLTLEHPMGRIPRLAPLFNRGPFPFGGDGNTISQAGTTPLRPLANPTNVASLRFAVEVGDWDGARFCLPGGQSGNPLSPHYDDQLPLWLRGEGIPLPWTEEAVSRATRSTLHLWPLSIG